MGAQPVILRSEIYNFHRLDLTRQAGFIVTVYDTCDKLRAFARFEIFLRALSIPYQAQKTLF